MKAFEIELKKTKYADVKRLCSSLFVLAMQDCVLAADLKKKLINSLRDLMLIIEDEDNKLSSTNLDHIVKVANVIRNLINKGKDVDRQEFLKVLSVIEGIVSAQNINSVRPLNSDKYYEEQVKILQEKISELQRKDIANLNIQKKLAELIKEKAEVEHALQEMTTHTSQKEGEAETLRFQNEQLKLKLKDLTSQIDNFAEKEHQNFILKKELDKNKELIFQYKLELEQSKKQKDAINEWKNKISEAFKGLDEPLNNMKTEHERLVSLYKIYKYSSIGLVGILLIIEIIVYCKIYTVEGYPTWEEYWSMILPVPVTVGLLWGFITQMNRSQRQMVFLAHQIHEIKYTEGLLQALNTLSIDINESMRKINEAISRLIDNHLHNLSSLHINENELMKLEKKDAPPIDKLTELLKLLQNK